MKLIYIGVALALTCMLYGCGAKVQVYRMKAAEVDMSSMRRLVVLDFDYYRGDVDSVEDFLLGIVVRSVGLHYGEDSNIREAASYATDKLRATLKNTGYFKLIDSVALRDVHRSKNAIEISRGLGADALLAASLKHAECEVENFFKEEEGYDASRQQKVIHQEPWVRQRCQLTLSYKVIRTADNIVQITKRFSKYRDEEVEEGLLPSFPDPEEWYQEMIDEIIPQIVHQLTPYETTETRYLKAGKGGDAVMERGMALVEAGKLGQARDLFLQHWRATGNPAAGYNAAILYEAKGDLAKAAKLLAEIVSISNDSSILQEHRLVLEALEERRRATEQLR